MILFELGEARNIDLSEDELQDLKAHLDRLWIKPFTQDVSISQKILNFQNNQVSANNYIGQILHPSIQITILPKFLKQQPVEPSLFFQHLALYLEWSLTSNFRGGELSKATKVNTFQEFFTLWFAQLTWDTLNGLTFQQLEEKKQESNYIKGKLQLKPYIQKNLTKGNWHKFTVQNQQLVYDNLLHRIIKYTASSLLNATSSKSIQKILKQILTQLADVKLTTCTASDCLKVHLTNYYKAYQPILDLCYFLLQQKQTAQGIEQATSFSVILPMEHIFEKMLSQIILSKFPEQSPQAQSTTYLAKRGEKPVFQLRNDIYFEKKNWIIDFKYKLLNPKKANLGVSEKDIYQMLSYLTLRNAQKGFLVYPATNHRPPIQDCFTIETQQGKVEIFIQEISLWAEQVENIIPNIQKELEKLFFG